MKIYLTAMCGCETKHTASNYDDVYPICNVCGEDLEWFDPDEDVEEFERKIRKKERKKFKKGLDS